MRSRSRSSALAEMIVCLCGAKTRFTESGRFEACRPRNSILTFEQGGCEDADVSAARRAQSPFIAHKGSRMDQSNPIHRR